MSKLTLIFCQFVCQFAKNSYFQWTPKSGRWSRFAGTNGVPVKKMSGRNREVVH